MEQLNEFLASGSFDVQELNRLLRGVKEERRKKKPARLEKRRVRRKRRKPPVITKSTRVTRSDVSRALMGGERIPSHIHETIIGLHGVIKCFSCNQVKSKGQFDSNHRTCKVCCAKGRRKTLLSYVKRQLKDCSTRTDNFDLSPEWVCSRFHELGGNCELCGEEMTHTTRAGGEEQRFNQYPMNLSLDQIVEGAGYLKSNIQLTHLKCNLMKLDLGMKEFVRTCSLIHKKHGII
jgi:hypothetical protein